MRWIKVFEIKHKFLPERNILPYIEDAKTITDFHLLLEFEQNVNQSFIQTIKSIKRLSFQIDKWDKFSVSGDQLLCLLELDHDQYTKMENVWNQKQQLVFPLYQLMFGGDFEIFTLHSFETDISFLNNSKIGSLSFITALSSGAPADSRLNNTSFEKSYHIIDTQLAHEEKCVLSFQDSTPFALIMKKPEDMCLTISEKYQLLNSTISHITHNTYLQSENHFCFFDNKFPTLQFLFRDQERYEGTKASIIICCKEFLGWSCG